jgi:cytochrome c-type biogenesis protein CcmH
MIPRPRLPFARLTLAMLMAATLALGVAAAVSSSPALAMEPEERLADPALEERARDLSKGLRCVVCQNQSIDDSNAELAQDLRRVVRERLAEGDTNDEVIDYVVARYGDYVLLRPPMNTRTLLLWFGPAAAVLGAAVWATLWVARRRRIPAAGPEPLSEEERRRLDELTRGGPDDGDGGLSTGRSGA